MGTGFSMTEAEYAKQVTSFKQTELTVDNAEELDKFLGVSHDFNFVFTSISLDDFRQVKRDKPQNAIHLISHVSKKRISRKIRFDQRLSQFLGCQSHV